MPKYRRGNIEQVAAARRQEAREKKPPVVFPFSSYSEGTTAILRFLAPTTGVISNISIYVEDVGENPKLTMLTEGQDKKTEQAIEVKKGINVVPGKFLLQIADRVTVVGTDVKGVWLSYFFAIGAETQDA